MNLEWFIARKLLKGGEKEAVSVPIVKIAVVGIALGVCVMLLSVFIVTGFKKEITAKLSGFSSHLNVTAYENNNSYSGSEIRVNDTLLNGIRRMSSLKQVYPYVTMPAILKSKSEIHGVVLKGVDSAYLPDFYLKHLKSGEYPDLKTPKASNDILISVSVAQMLGVEPGEKVRAHFVQDPPRVRVFQVKGIYDTGFREYDDMIVLCDLRHLQKLNGWEADQVSAVGIELEDMEEIPEKEAELDAILPVAGEDGFYKITSLWETATQIFDWLNLINMNVWVILTLIVVVAGFNMVSGLLIFILDKTALIGILKAMGCRNVSLKRVFLYVALGLIGRGMIAGNVLALVLGGIQYYFRLIRLDPLSYYMDTVPVYFNIWYILLLNAGVWCISVLMLLAPAMLVSRITPIKAIRFE
ncbi:ABC transporter permease [Odoribacter sp. Z80]|uniref:ABC transporter permease n=1 Tax=Odoribacter sp. Z80 TaxID=2304575 RepID=UPI00137B05A6|nr:ABC transporter permease [Odoribacter sp. Z80]NCE71827.1 ABC transporter permease [Odoribacter sp. Z80]